MTHEFENFTSLKTMLLKNGIILVSPINTWKSVLTKATHMEPISLLTVEIRHSMESWKPQRLLKTLMENKAPVNKGIIKHESLYN